MRKILALVSSCSQCPNRQYVSGGSYDCILAGERIPADSTIAPFCPLSDFPARIIAEQATTIMALRGEQTIPFTIELLSLIAKKLGVNLSSDFRGFVIELEDGEKVFFGHDSFTFGQHLREVLFTTPGGRNYRLFMGNNPELQVEVNRQSESGKKLWSECTLKKK